MKKVRHESDIQALYNAAKALSTISAWQSHGLFAALAAGAKPLSELVGDPRALAVTAPVLVHLGLLSTDGLRYGLTESGRALLEANALPGAQGFDTLRDYSRMTDVLREGGPVRGDDGEHKITTGGVVLHDPERTRRFLGMLYNMSEASAREVLAWMQPRLNPGAHVLDLGGGHGRYARLFADSGFSATLMDFPLVVELAQERHEEHIAYRAGDFLAGADLGGPYDMALLSNIVHGQSDGENADLVTRIYDALAPGGWLVLKDMFIDEQRSGPENAVFFGLTMLYYTRAGSSPTLGHAQRWAADAGFGPIEIVTLDTHLLVLARK